MIGGLAETIMQYECGATFATPAGLSVLTQAIGRGTTMLFIRL